MSGLERVRRAGPGTIIGALAMLALAGGGGPVAAQATPADPAAADDYRAARELLAAGRFGPAAEAFAEVRSDHPDSEYAADAYYWEAFALARRGERDDLRRAVELLEQQGRAHPNAATRADAEALRVRIEGALARRGDARAAAEVARQAQVPCGPGHETRLAALSALMSMNAEQALPILREVLRQRDECSAELRAQAVFLVAQKLTDESVDILLDLAHRNPDPDPEVRAQAVFWLHQVRRPEALDALESILLESEDRELQEQAIFGLSQWGDEPRALEVLRAYARRPDAPEGLRADAIFWLGQSGGQDAIDALIELYPGMESPEMRENTLFAIAQGGGPRARAWLLERVRDPAESMEMRKNALFWASQTGGVPASDLQALFDATDDPELRDQVVFVAGQRGNAEDVDLLMHIARNAEDPELRENAIFWLGQTDDPRVADFLVELLRGP